VDVRPALVSPGPGANLAASPGITSFGPDRYLYLPDAGIFGSDDIVAVDRAMRPTDFIRDHVVPVGGRFCPLCPGHELKTPPEVLAYRPDGGQQDQRGDSTMR
jgi:hypothetical protein